MGNKEGAYKEILFIKIKIHYDVCIFNLTQLFPIENLQMILVHRACGIMMVRPGLAYMVLMQKILPVGLMDLPWISVHQACGTMMVRPGLS